MTVVLGIDPGGRSTGFVLRDGETLLAHDVLDRHDASRPLWVEACVEAADNMAHEATVDLVAIEDLNDPVAAMGMTSVRGLIDTAVVIGALLCWAQDPTTGVQVVLVPPGRHGRAAEGLGRAGLLAAYPGLVGDRETSGTGRLRHARAAYDVCAAAVREQLTLVEGNGA